MSENKCPKCVEKINALIANTESGFVEDDREWLDTLSESALDKVAPKVIEKEKIVEKEVQVNVLSKEDQEALATYKKEKKEKRERMIKDIQANSSKELWPEATLTVMDEDTLKRVLDSVKKEDVTDYSLFGGTTTTNFEKVEALYPTGVEIETKK